MKNIVRIILTVFTAFLLFISITGCEKKEVNGRADKSFMTNDERKESYVIGTDIAAMIKSSGGYETEFSKEAFLRAYDDVFNNRKLLVNMKEVRKVFSNPDSASIKVNDLVFDGSVAKKDKQSYIYGAYHADVVRSNPETFNLKSFISGFEDEFDNRPKLFSDEEINDIKNESKKRIDKLLTNAERTLSNEERENLNKEFLKMNAKREAVKVLPSGLQYAVIKNGTEEKTINDTTSVKVEYRAFFIDGREFDSSYKNGVPAEFRLTEVIPGWREGIKLMSKGSIYKFFIPYDLAYGKEGLRDVPPSATLIFEIELIEVKK